MSPGQQKLMQYLPVVFAVFQVFFLLGLVIYYMAQAILRIAAAGLHHQGASTATTRPSAARPSVPESRPASWPRSSRARTAAVAGSSPRRAVTSAPRRATDRRRAEARPATGDGEPGREPTVEAHDRAEEPPDAVGQGTGGTTEEGVDCRSSRGRAHEEQRQTPQMTTALPPGHRPPDDRARQETTMEWVETTGKSLDQAKDLALDQLGCRCR